MKYPNSINIEITNNCNLKCNFCVNSKMERSKKDIAPEIFEKVISNLKDYPDVNNIIPVGLGEPFLNKKWYEIFVLLRNKKLFPINNFFHKMEIEAWRSSRCYLYTRT